VRAFHGDKSRERERERDRKTDREIDKKSDRRDNSVVACCFKSEYIYKIKMGLRRRLLTLESTEIDVNVFFLLWATTLVFIMQGGFMLLEVGSVSIRNTKNILFKNAFDICISACCFYMWGYAFAYGDDSSGGFIGSTDFALSDIEKRGGGTFFAGSTTNGGIRADAAFFYAHFAFALSFAATAATIMSGAVAERMNFKAYIPLTVMTVSFIYPTVVHWVWSTRGWMSAYHEDAGERLFGVGVLDFAGSLVVHVVGGTAALVACWYIGPRSERFGIGGKINELPMQSPVFQMIGTILMWFGWYGFNTGSVGMLVRSEQFEGVSRFIVARTAVCTTIAAAFGGLSVVVFDLARDKKQISPQRMNNGILTGLVSISGSCALIHPAFAVLIGIVAGVVYSLGSSLLLRRRIDDVVDAVPIHLFGGVWGLLATALFTKKEFYNLVYNGPDAKRDYCGAMIGCGKNAGNALAAALVALLVVVSFTSTMIYALILFLEKVAKVPLRVAPVIESQGLDQSTHFGRAYTELQTTIFQYTTKSGEKASMEMRVRAGDAAKFALALSEVMDAEVGKKEGGSGRFSRLALSDNGGPEAGESGGGRRGFGSLLGNPASTIQESG